MKRLKLLATVMVAALIAAPFSGAAALAADGTASESADTITAADTAVTAQTVAGTTADTDASASAVTVTTYDAEATGTLGTCTWTVEDGVLKIAPTNGTSGTLAAHTWNADWYAYRESITSVVIEKGVTAAADSSYLFSYLENAVSFSGLENLDTSNVTTMEGMFYYCTSVNSIRLSGWDTSKVTSMNSMFYYCRVMYGLQMSDIYTANVTDMAYMFYSCFEIVTLDLSCFKTTNVKYMDQMFRDCNYLTTIYVSDYWSKDSVVSSKWMFLNCSNLVGQRGTTYQSDNTDVTYARVDAVGLMGYMTYKEYTGTIYANDADSDNYSSSKKTQTITVNKARIRRTIRYKRLKKKAVSFKIKATTSGNGRVTYEKVSGNKKIKVNSVGRVTVPKGMKKKTYKIRVRITAAETSTYAQASVVKTVKIKVRKKK